VKRSLRCNGIPRPTVRGIDANDQPHALSRWAHRGVPYADKVLDVRFAGPLPPGGNPETVRMT
jgi:hypothetical protein